MSPLANSSDGKMPEAPLADRQLLSDPRCRITPAVLKNPCEPGGRLPGESDP
jgi:hypothetical protein